MGTTAAAVLVTSLSWTAEVQTQAQAPTFTKDVAPILYKSCVNCHRPGQVAPMSLLSYDEVRPWAKAIRSKVLNREMPPWPADDSSRTMRNDRRLSPREIDTVVAWVDAGSPKGRDADLQAPPTFASGWAHPKNIPPDFVIEAPEIDLAAEGQVMVDSVYVPLPFREDVYVDAAQLLPGNFEAVHHEIAYVSTLPPTAKFDDKGRWLNAPASRGGNAPRLASTNGSAPSVDVFDTASNVWLVGFVPGGGFLEYAPGVGNRIQAGPNKYLRFDLHYTPTGKPEKDRSRFGIWLQKVPLTHELIFRRIGETHIVEGKEIVGEGSVAPRGSRSLPNIPPYAENFAMTAITPVLDDITIYNFQVHMHLRGKDMRILVVYPDGREETLVSVPKYNFEWQLFYELAEPARIPAGSKLIATGHLDNSLKNKVNPGPDKEVYWGEQSWDEMFNGWINYTVDKNDLTKISRTQPQP
jgi:hypothetical protein